MGGLAVLVALVAGWLYPMVALANETNQITAAIWSDTGQTDTTMSVGFAATGTIWGTVFYDLNMDGIHGLGEGGVQEATVCLYSDENADTVLDANDIKLDCTLTDVQGNYFFPDLSYGHYLVYEVPQTGVGHVTPLLRAVFLDPAAASAVEAAPFGDVLLADVRGMLFVDSNANGIMDADETTGIAFASVQALHLGSGTSYQATTDANGYYTLQDLWPGDYVLAVSYSVPGYYIASQTVATYHFAFGDDIEDVNFAYLPGSIHPFPDQSSYTIFAPWIITN